MSWAVRIGNSLCQEIRREQPGQWAGAQTEGREGLWRRKTNERSNYGTEESGTSRHFWDKASIHGKFFAALQSTHPFLRLSCLLCQSIFYNCRHGAMNPNPSSTPRSLNDRWGWEWVLRQSKKWKGKDSEEWSRGETCRKKWQKQRGKRKVPETG